MFSNFTNVLRFFELQYFKCKTVTISIMWFLEIFFNSFSDYIHTHFLS